MACSQPGFEDDAVTQDLHDRGKAFRAEDLGVPPPHAAGRYGGVPIRSLTSPISPSSASR